jgi:hypothetical protein
LASWGHFRQFLSLLGCPWIAFGRPWAARGAPARHLVFHGTPFVATWLHFWGRGCSNDESWGRSAALDVIFVSFWVNFVVVWVPSCFRSCFLSFLLSLREDSRTDKETFEVNSRLETREPNLHSSACSTLVKQGPVDIYVYQCEPVHVHARCNVEQSAVSPS